MATWGKKIIKLDSYNPEATLYYEYNTTVDAYYFRYKGQEEYGYGGPEPFDIETRMSNEQGDAMLEALINHVLDFKCSGDVEYFVDQYIKNNRFRK